MLDRAKIVYSDSELSSASFTVSFNFCSSVSKGAGISQRLTTYILQKMLQFIVFPFLDENMLVVDVFDDEGVAMLLVYPHDDGLDRWITLHQYAFTCIVSTVDTSTGSHHHLALLEASCTYSFGGCL